MFEQYEWPQVGKYLTCLQIFDSLKTRQYLVTASGDTLLVNVWYMLRKQSMHGKWMDCEIYVENFLVW